MAASDRNPFPMKCSQDCRGTDLVLPSQKCHGPFVLVELEDLSNLVTIERRAPTRNSLTLEMLEHRVSMDLEPVG
jgi:hypothetical protein